MLFFPSDVSDIGTVSIPAEVGKVQFVVGTICVSSEVAS